MHELFLYHLKRSAAAAVSFPLTCVHFCLERAVISAAKMLLLVC